MKASKFSEAQIAFVLKQAEEGAAVAPAHPQQAQNGPANPAAVGDHLQSCRPSRSPTFSNLTCDSTEIPTNLS